MAVLPPDPEKYPTGVIIVNYHSRAYLSTALRCLTFQTFTPRHIVVVNNGDVKPLYELEKKYPYVIFVEPENNLGFAAANNLGAAFLKDCVFIALLNPDAFPRKDWLARLVHAAVTKPEYRFFGSRMLSMQIPLVTDGTGDVYHITGLIFRKKHGKPPDERDLVSKEIFSPCAAAALYYLEDFSAEGGFDPDYFCYSEDVDLGFRLRLKGKKALYVPEAVVFHEGSAITGRHSPFSIYYGHRNLVWTFFKNMPDLMLLAFLPFHILLNVISFFWFAGKGMTGAILRAKKDAFAGLHVILAKRRIIQRNKTISNGELIKILTFKLNLRDRFK